MSNNVINQFLQKQFSQIYKFNIILLLSDLFELK